MAKLARIRFASAAGVDPNSRRNSRLNCDALAWPTAWHAASAVKSWRTMSDALHLVRGKLVERQRDLDAWETVTLSTDG